MQALPTEWMSPVAKPFVALAIGMVLSGFEHYWNESWYAQVMQDWIPNKVLIIRISIAIRILAGLALLHPASRLIAANVCIVLYFVVLPVNLRIAFAGDKVPGLDMPVWRRWFRLAMHIGWLIWCFWCCRIA